MTEGSRRPHRVAVVVVPGTLALDLAVAVQAFGPRSAVFAKIRDEARSPYEILLCGGAPVAASGTPGFSIGELAGVERIAAADTVLVPGLDDPLASQDPEVLDAIARAGRAGARLVSLCAGAFVLGQAGVLDGHRVTTHWALAQEFRAAFPGVHLLEHALYVDDGQVLSSGGMLAATDLCLHLLRQDHGQSYANDMSRMLISPPHRSGGQSQYTKLRGERPTGSLAPLMEWMLANLDAELSLDAVAAMAHLSTRTLARRFRSATGLGLASWVAQHRVERARALLEDTDLTVTQIAHAAGFGSTESLRRAFARHTGTSPGAYRRTFTGRARRGA